MNDDGQRRKQKLGVLLRDFIGQGGLFLRHRADRLEKGAQLFRLQLKAAPGGLHGAEPRNQADASPRQHQLGDGPFLERDGGAVDDGVEVLFDHGVVVARQVPDAAEHLVQFERAHRDVLRKDRLFPLEDAEADGPGPDVGDQRVRLFVLLLLFLQQLQCPVVNQRLFLVFLQHFDRHAVLDFELVEDIGAVGGLAQSGRRDDPVFSHAVLLHDFAVAPQKGRELTQAFKADSAVRENFVPDPDGALQAVDVDNPALLELGNPHLQRVGIDIDNGGFLHVLFVIHRFPSAFAAMQRYFIKFFIF